MNLQENQLVNNIQGEGWVYKRKILIAKVLYRLQTSLDKKDRSVGNPIVIGKIKRVDNANILWGFEKYTLFLEDKRKLDFVCVNYDPDCEISSDTGFYL